MVAKRKGISRLVQKQPAHLKVFPYRSTVEWWQIDKGLADWAQYQHTRKCPLIALP
ncbi:hypothetical protein AOLE_01120 [Acinetobacter oleivorans DR1]|uniref:Uncharacterized protein n=1 Tax=Acinetobacter oleivorans (strain JCM 16667 / KCTC 23045 / DR1) TaxID=436717 RepID=A0AAN0P5G0_ACISD|nr:hypothetical protein AOLE_01120 [Acinetobacter oleivorans DR1]